MFGLENLDPTIQIFIATIMAFVAGYGCHWYNSKVGYCPKCDINWRYERKCRECGTKLITAKFCPQKKHGVIDEATE